MTELTLDNLNEVFISESMKEHTLKGDIGNGPQDLVVLYETYQLGRFKIDIGYNPRSEKPWSVTGGTRTFGLYKNFTGVKNYIKKVNQLN